MLPAILGWFHAISPSFDVSGYSFHTSSTSYCPVPAIEVSRGCPLLPVGSREVSWAVLTQNPVWEKALETELCRAWQYRVRACRLSWWDAGGDGAWSSIPMWAPTAEEMIGIHSVIWPPCNNRVPLVQWFRRPRCGSAGGSVTRTFFGPESDEASASEEAVDRPYHGMRTQRGNAKESAGLWVSHCKCGERKMWLNTSPQLRDVFFCAFEHCAFTVARSLFSNYAAQPTSLSSKFANGR